MNANENTLPWRMTELERRMNEIKPEALVAEVLSLRMEMRTLKKLLWTLIFTIIGASTSLTIALLTTAGKPHL